VGRPTCSQFALNSFVADFRIAEGIVNDPLINRTRHIDGLARSVGLPARHVYGLRIGKSEYGYKSLGLSTDNATRGQHCRAEVFPREHGWVPVDPADVRKVILEEPPGNRPLSDAMGAKIASQLTGKETSSWLTQKSVRIRIAAARWAKKKNIAVHTVKVPKELRLLRANADIQTARAT
jgi:hypothetical protein